jgi:anaerobic ribonucleoside-triphosphate reductase activating protein
MNADKLLVPVAAFLPRSRANGPGLRAVLWVQGCPFRCPGCFNPDFQPFAGGHLTPAATVAGWILDRADIEGVTFSGGEPFAHAEALAAVAALVRRAGRSVVIFTGYQKEVLQATVDEGQRRLLAAADLLIAGPYRRDRPSRQPWLGSDNQELVFLTNRYSRRDLETGRRRVEFHFSRDGQMTVTGFPVKPWETQV